jgi:hypothetical protein
VRVVNGIRNYDRAVQALFGGGAAERLSRLATHFDPVGFATTPLYAAFGQSLTAVSSGSP